MIKIAALLLLLYSFSASGQMPMTSTRVLSKYDIAGIFPDSVTKRLGISYPIRIAYAYSDNSGEYYLVLSEKFLKKDEQNDSLYSAIKAVNIKDGSGWPDEKMGV